MKIENAQYNKNEQDEIIPVLDFSELDEDTKFYLGAQVVINESTGMVNKNVT